jgi:hypothetical protein
MEEIQIFIPNKKFKYLYKVRECNTHEEVNTALEYYRSELKINETLTHADRHNISEILFRLKQKQEIIEELMNAVNLSELPPIEITRQDAVVELVKHLPEFFQYKQPAIQQQWGFVTKLFKIYLGVLNNSGIRWNQKFYSDIPKFINSGKKDEMIIFLIHEVITTGLHVPKQIIKQINLLIKLVNHLKVDDQVPIKLPTSKDLELKMILADFKY